MLCFNWPSASIKANSFSTLRKAANVFPVPVGDTIRAFSPRSITGHAANCAGVASSNFSANHFVTGELFSGNGINKLFQPNHHRSNLVPENSPHTQRHA